MRRVPLVALGVALLAMALVLAFHLDIAATKFIRNDLVLRASPYDPSLAPCPMDDRSGYALWAPVHQHLRESLRSGELPLWNRMQGGGYSTLAELQPGVAFPLKWIVVLAPAWAAESLLVIASLLAAFLGAYFMLVDRRVSNLAAVSGALLFAGSVHYSTFTHLGGPPLCLAPWLAWSASRLVVRGRYRDFAATSAIAALLPLSGHPLLATASGLAAAAIVLPDVRRAPARRRAFGMLALAAFAGACLAAAALLPFLSALPGTWTYKTATAEGQSYHPFAFTQWLRVLGASVVWPAIGRELDRAPSYDYFGLPMAALVAFGLHAAARRPATRFLLYALPIAFLLAVPGPWMAPLAELPLLRFFKPSYLFVMLTLSAAAAAAVGIDAVRERFPRHATAAVVAAVAVTLATNLYLVRALLTPVESRWLEPTPALSFLRTAEGSRISGLWGQLHAPNAAVITGVEDMRGTFAIMSRRYHRWFEIVDPEILERSFPTTRITPVLGSPLFGAFNVRYFLRGRVPFRVDYSALRPDEPKVYPPELARIEGPTVARVFADDSVEIYQNLLDVRPRAYIAARVAPVTGGPETAAAALGEALARDPAAPLAADVVEAPDDAALARLRALPEAHGTAAVHYPGHRSVHIDVDTDADALLVLDDLYDPGWSASVDGSPAPIFAVNLIARGVLVPAGQHTVQMSFWPQGLTEGLLVSGLSALVLLLLGIRARQRADE